MFRFPPFLQHLDLLLHVYPFSFLSLPQLLFLAKCQSFLMFPYVIPFLIPTVTQVAFLYLKSHKLCSQPIVTLIQCGIQIIHINPIKTSIKEKAFHYIFLIFYGSKKSEIPNLPTITSIIFSIKRLDPHHYSNTQPSPSMFIISLFLSLSHLPATRYFLFYFSSSIFSLSLDSSFPAKHQPFSTFPYVIPFWILTVKYWKCVLYYMNNIVQERAFI